MTHCQLLTLTFSHDKSGFNPYQNIDSTEAAKRRSWMKHPSLRLVFLSYLFMFLIVITGLYGTALVARGGDFSGLMIAGIFLILSAWIIWIFRLRRWFRLRKSDPEAKIHPLAIFFIVLFLVGGLATTFASMPQIYQSTRLETGLRQYVKDEISEKTVPMPENPHYVFYDLDTKKFAVPGKNFYRRTKNPSEANVIVAYRSEIARNGTWVKANGGARVGDAYVQRVTLYVLRTSDWSLIATNTVEEQMGYGKTSKFDMKSINGINGVSSYLRGLFKD